MKNLNLGLVASLALVSAASAQPFLNGSFGALELTNGSTFSATSLTLNPNNNLITGSETGDFSTQVPAFSDLTAYSLTVTGIGSTPTAMVIPNFFIFSSPDPLFGSPGTTPINRFEFNLLTIASPSLDTFTGTGTIIDTAPTSTFAPTAGSFIVSFSSPANAPLSAGVYSLTFNALGVPAVPEPTTISFFATGLLGAWALHRRKKAAR